MSKTTPVATAIREIRFTSIAATGEQFRRLNLAPGEIGSALNAALALSATKAQRLARGILTTLGSREQLEAEAPALIAWARDAGSVERRTLANAFLQQRGGGLFLIHQLALLPGNSARAFLADFRAAGGDLKPVLEWLRLVGEGIRASQAPDGNGTALSFGFDDIWEAGKDIVHWAKDKAGEAIDTVAEAVASVVNAVGDGFQALVDVVGAMAGWPLSQIRDVVQGLLTAGKSSADILSAAVQSGLDVLQKFVTALNQTVTRPLGDILSWLAEQAGAVAQAGIAVLQKAMTVGAILFTAIGTGLSHVIQGVVATFLEMGLSLGDLLRRALEKTFETFRTVFQTLLDLGRAAGEVLASALAQSIELFRTAVEFLLEAGRSVGQILAAIADSALDALQAAVQVLLKLGKGVVEVAAWATEQSLDLFKATLRALEKAGLKLIQIVADVAVGAAHLLNQVLDAIYKAGRWISEVLRDAADLATDVLATILRESFKLGQTVAAFVNHTLHQTYKQANRLIRAALEAGAKVGELLEGIAKRTYWHLRKVIHGVFASIGPVGEVLDWALTQAEGLSDQLWHQTLTALRYSGAKLTEALDWALAQSSEIFTAVANAWESAGEDLVALFEWASKQATAAVWFVIGQAWAKLANSCSYALTYLEKDLLPGVRQFVEGMVQSGVTLATFAAEFAGRSLVLVQELVTTLLDLGFTLEDLLIETVRHPEDALKNFLAAAKAAGRSTQELVAASVESGEGVVRDTAAAWKELEADAVEILEAALEISLGAVGAYLSFLLTWWGVHRPLNAEERASAEIIFGESIDLDRVLVSVVNPPVEVIELCNDQRPFTTNYVLNFASWEEAVPAKVIHELTHVWQSVEEGPFYMSQALHAQAEFGQDAYNYGFDKTPAGRRRGDGAEATLQLGNGDFAQLNREQQGKLIEHYFVRRFVDQLPATALDPATKEVRPSYEAWQPYANAVHA